ncbi:MAG: gluconate 2-dehydrogenase subunit 3 family protein [Blastocatellia bacterium]|nr:gluconate 2-dehydrogenase subunit 3 family protein [Blastocatellia bacterium]
MGDEKNEKKILDLTRREMIKFMSVAAAAVPGTGKGRQKTQPKAHQFFTPAEFTLVDELSEMIIPADDHSPGAREAKVAAFVDQTLGETLDTQMKQRWREGLKSIEAITQEMHGKSFINAAPDQRAATLDRIAKNETDPQKPEDKFFVELKSAVAFAYYTSKIGLRQELEYKGNTYLKEFVGEEV